jgi:hypothetical protein
MAKLCGLGLAGALALVTGLGSVGCVSVEQHREALADLQRLRVEAWQRSVESAALRVTLDRIAAENAQLRAQPRFVGPDPAIAALAARVDDMARRQEVIAEEMRAVPVCTPGMPVAQSAQQPAQQQGRKVTDLLYSRF